MQSRNMEERGYLMKKQEQLYVCPKAEECRGKNDCIRVNPHKCNEFCISMTVGSKDCPACIPVKQESKIKGGKMKRKNDYWLRSRLVSQVATVICDHSDLSIKQGRVIARLILERIREVVNEKTKQG